VIFIEIPEKVVNCAPSLFSNARLAFEDMLQLFPVGYGQLLKTNENVAFLYAGGEESFNLLLV
jgi:hypothetical protein